MITPVNYIRPGKNAKPKAIATLKYNVRFHKGAEEMLKDLFGPDGKLTFEQAEVIITGAPDNVRFFRIKFSPSIKTENPNKDLNLRDVTKYAMNALEEELRKRGVKEISYIAIQHNDTDIPHIHCIALIPSSALINNQLTLKDLDIINGPALEAAMEQQKNRDRGQPEILTAEVQRLTSPAPTQHHTQSLIGNAGGKATRSREEPRVMVGAVRHPCTQCGPGLEMQPIGNGAYWCRNCGNEQGKEEECELSL